MPFAPFLEAFGHLARYASEEVLQNHTARHGSRLARMVPDLAERVQQLASEIERLRAALGQHGIDPHDKPA